MNYKKPSAAYTGTRSRAAQNRKKSHEDLLREARCDSSLKSIAFEAMRGTLTRLCDHARWVAPLAFAVLLLWGLAGVFAPRKYQSGPSLPTFCFIVRDAWWCTITRSTCGIPGSSKTAQ